MTDLLEKRKHEHLKGCKLSEKRYNKLVDILTKMRSGSDNSNTLLVKFADKCYKTTEDRDEARKQAQQFLAALFGSVEEIYSLGPKKALEARIKNLYDVIHVEELGRKSSEKFNVLKHGRHLKGDIENSSIWSCKLDRFLVGPTLGVGGTATVRLAYDTDVKAQVALKILQPKYAHSAKQEIDMLKKLNHKNIIRLYECFDNVMWENRKTTVFAIEYANGGELIEYLMYTAKFEAELARWFFHELVEGVEYCHNQDIVHRDLKHDNCLLGNDFSLKITDFGFARKYFRDDKEQMKTAIGTAQYAAPEILAQKAYDEKVDIFSMGVMLFIALAGSQPWRKADPSNDRWYNWAYNKEWNQFWSYHANRGHKFDKESKELLEGMLAHKPKNRMSIAMIKKTAWYKGKCMRNEEAARALKKRKRDMDQKKFDAAKREKETRKAIPDIPTQDDKNLYLKADPPLCDLWHIPITSFYTKDNAKIVMEKIQNAIHMLKGDHKLGDAPFELSFEVKKSHGLTSKKNTDKNFYVVGGKINIYKKSADESGTSLVVFTSTRDFNSRAYLPKIFGDIMGQIAYLRCDMKREQAEDLDDLKID